MLLSTLVAHPGPNTLRLKRPRRQMGQKQRIGLSRPNCPALADPTLRRQWHSDLIKRRAGLAEQQDVSPALRSRSVRPVDASGPVGSEAKAAIRTGTAEPRSAVPPVVGQRFVGGLLRRQLL